MKKFLYSLVFAVVALAANQVKATTPVGAVTFNLTVLQQGVYASHTTTNKTSVSTNYMSTGSDSVTSFTIDNTKLLAMLASSLGVTFDKGDSLAIGTYGQFYVVDKTKTNIVKDVSAILAYSFGASVYKDAYKDSELTAATGTGTNRQVKTTYSGTDAYTQTSVVTLTYDDSKLKTTTNVTTFTVTGLATYAEDYNEGTQIGSINYSMPSSAGSGTVKGHKIP